MRRVSLAVVVAFVLLFVCALVVFGQGGTLRLLQPAVATINQSVPVQVTLGGIVNGQQVTLTAPLTMNVALQVQLVGGGAVVAQAGAVQAAPATAAQPTPAPIRYDSRGIPYRADVRLPFVLTQIESSINGMERVSVVGEIQNAGADTLQYVQAIISFYKDGKIVEVDQGYTALDKLLPGQSSPFQVTTFLQPDQVNAYTVQVDGRPVR